MELLLELCIELFGEAILQILMEAGLATAQEAAGRENRNPALATIGYWLFGAILGGPGDVVRRGGVRVRPRPRALPLVAVGGMLIHLDKLYID